MFRIKILFVCSVLLLVAAPSIASAEEVDLELVLAMDASGSISDSEYLLQLEGTSAAFRDPAIQAAIESGPIGKIAVTIMLWSDAAFPKVNSGWFVLDSPQSANAFAAFVSTFQLNEDKSIGFGGGGTGIGSGVEEGLRLLKNNRYRGLRRVIDVSGDGVETQFWFSKSIMMPDAKILARAENVIINGLPILTRDFPDLDEYYRENVISGPGSFIVRAKDFQDFGRAIRQKLLREISANVAHLKIPRDSANKVANLSVKLGDH
ncbi:MAG: DUF1194 domain-containing protein [Pseudomonadota bacterium]